MRDSFPFNKVCDEADWEFSDIRQIMTNVLHLPEQALTNKERKHWEWSLGFKALKDYGYLDKSNKALGIACGHEAVMYALTNYLDSVTGIDLYGATKFSGQEAQADVVAHPEKYCKFPYEKSRLQLKKMNALSLAFPDNTFDIAFSFSSIEHFGGSAQVLQSMRETWRVLKPGGIYVLSVDYIFQNPWPHLPRSLRWREAAEYLTRQEVEELLIKRSGFRLRDPVSFDVATEKVTNVYDCLTNTTSTGKQYPHIYVKFQKGFLRKYLFSSLFLVLFKEASP
ncbi:MAG: methyltransferase domain-containing protein [Oligoflexales bacterium]